VSAFPETGRSSVCFGEVPTGWFRPEAVAQEWLLFPNWPFSLRPIFLDGFIDIDDNIIGVVNQLNNGGCSHAPTNPVFVASNRGKTEGGRLVGATAVGHYIAHSCDVNEPGVYLKLLCFGGLFNPTTYSPKRPVM